MVWFNKSARFFGALALLASSGCAAVRTQHVATAPAVAQGIAYYLPSGLLRLSIVESGGAISVTLDGPHIVQDNDALLVSHLPRSGTADNNVTVTVDPNTHFLSKVEATSTGRLADITANAVRSFSFLQSAQERSGETIFERDFMWDEAGVVTRAANRALAAYFHQNCGRGFAPENEPFSRELGQLGKESEAEAAARRQRVLLCQRLAMAGLTSRPEQTLIELSVDNLRSPSLRADAAALDYGVCGRGICYRPFMPLRMTLRVGEYFSQTKSFLIPDENRLMFVNLASGVFAEQKYTLTFHQGRLTSYQQDADSELVGLARLPGNIVGGLISGPAEALGLRQQSLTAETSYLNAVRSNIEAQQQTADQCRDNPQACEPGAYNVIRIPLGRPPATEPGRPGDSGGVASDRDQNGGAKEKPPGQDG